MLNSKSVLSILPIFTVVLSSQVSFATAEGTEGARPPLRASTVKPPHGELGVFEGECTFVTAFNSSNPKELPLVDCVADGTSLGIMRSRKGNDGVIRLFTGPYNAPRDVYDLTYLREGDRISFSGGYHWIPFFGTGYYDVEVSEIEVLR
jgi:hypothetical protein